MHYSKGFSLIEVMISIAVMSILATVAVPAYVDYVARAQIGEALTIMTSLKTEVHESEVMSGDFPTEYDNEDAMKSTLVESVTLERYEQCPGRGYINARMDSQKASAQIAGKTIRLEYLGKGVWYCSQGGADTVAVEYLPRTCRNSINLYDATECEIQLTSLGGGRYRANPGNNHGHGNNIDGVDSSNPGGSPRVDSDPNVDDER